MITTIRELYDTHRAELEKAQDEVQRQIAVVQAAQRAYMDAEWALIEAQERAAKFSTVVDEAKKALDGGKM